MSKSGGVFQIDDVTRTMSKGGGCAWCSTHPSSDPPPTWLAGYGPGCIYIYTEVYLSISFVVRRKYMFLVAAHFNLYQSGLSACGIRTLLNCVGYLILLMNLNVKTT